MDDSGSAGVDVAIVGAGIAGCSAAKFIREEFGAAATITVFEKAPVVGGRIQDITVAGKRLEAGGEAYTYTQSVPG